MRLFGFYVRRHAEKISDHANLELISILNKLATLVEKPVKEKVDKATAELTAAEKRIKALEEALKKKDAEVKPEVPVTAVPVVSAQKVDPPQQASQSAPSVTHNYYAPFPATSNAGNGTKNNRKGGQKEGSVNTTAATVATSEVKASPPAAVPSKDE